MTNCWSPLPCPRHPEEEIAARKTLESIRDVLGDRYKENESFTDRLKSVSVLANATAEATPWPARDVVDKLCEATSTLLIDHDYDAHGWELYDHALKAAQAWLRGESQTQEAKPGHNLWSRPGRIDDADPRIAKLRSDLEARHAIVEAAIAFVGSSRPESIALREAVSRLREHVSRVPCPPQNFHDHFREVVSTPRVGDALTGSQAHDYESSRASIGARPDEPLLAAVMRLKASCTGVAEPSDDERALRILPEHLSGVFWDDVRKRLATEFFRQRIQHNLELTKMAGPLETRADGAEVRKDRWESGMRNIAGFFVGARTEFEIKDIVERVRALLPSEPHSRDETVAHEEKKS